ncbi:MAG: 4-hydroxy-tetrahydrodipicolinate synthase [Peptococcaceae bacterium]|nr:4-hydroxy-tetrahydrodipicolinate synthase [Peptococcaceae bacterium]
MTFGRVMTAMITPFTAAGEVDYEEVKKLAVHLVEHGNDSLVVCGTTAETPTLTHEEKIKIVQTVQAAVGDKAKIIVGTGTNNTKTTIEASQEMAALGIDGLLIVAPYYNKPSQEGLYQHFKAVAESVELPIILYNIPGRCGINMEPATIARLAEIKNIVGVKEASGNLEQMSKVRKLTAPEFLLYSGDDSLTMPLLSIGGAGIISVAAHAVGDEMKAMVDAYFAGKVAEATAIHLKLYDFMKAIFVTSNPVPIKYVLSEMGIISNATVRLPLVEASENEKAVVKKAMEELKLI